MTVTAPAVAPFDPFADLSLPPDARPDGHQPINLRTLTSFQRALLAIDGTVTRFIEAYRMEPVTIEVLTQRSQVLANPQPWLDLPAGDEVLARDVHLRGAHSGRVYAHATSLLAPAQLPATVLEHLQTHPAGIGGALLASGAETRREIVWFGRGRLDPLPDPACAAHGRDHLARMYRVICGSRPVMVITERFPLDDDPYPDHH
jgi:chorismate-pyruvate lyase